MKHRSSSYSKSSSSGSSGRSVSSRSSNSSPSSRRSSSSSSSSSKSSISRRSPRSPTRTRRNPRRSPLPTRRDDRHKYVSRNRRYNSPPRGYNSRPYPGSKQIHRKSIDNRRNRSRSVSSSHSSKSRHARRPIARDSRNSVRSPLQYRSNGFKKHTSTIETKHKSTSPAQDHRSTNNKKPTISSKPDPKETHRIPTQPEHTNAENSKTTKSREEISSLNTTHKEEDSITPVNNTVIPAQDKKQTDDGIPNWEASKGTNEPAGHHENFNNTTPNKSSEKNDDSGITPNTTSIEIAPVYEVHKDQKSQEMNSERRESSTEFPADDINNLASLKESPLQTLEVPINHDNFKVGDQPRQIESQDDHISINYSDDEIMEDINPPKMPPNENTLYNPNNLNSATEMSAQKSYTSESKPNISEDHRRSTLKLHPTKPNDPTRSTTRHYSNYNQKQFYTPGSYQARFTHNRTNQPRQSYYANTPRDQTSTSNKILDRYNSKGDRNYTRNFYYENNTHKENYSRHRGPEFKDTRHGNDKSRAHLVKKQTTPFEFDWKHDMFEQLSKEPGKQRKKAYFWQSKELRQIQE